MTGLLHCFSCRGLLDSVLFLFVRLRNPTVLSGIGHWAVFKSKRSTCLESMSPFQRLVHSNCVQKKFRHFISRELPSFPRCSKSFTLIGLGWGMVCVSWICCVYYNMIIAWILYFLGHSFTGSLPWASCDNEWNTENCYTRGGAEPDDDSFLNWLGHLSTIL